MLEETEKAENKEQRYATKDYNLLKMQLAFEYCFQKTNNNNIYQRMN